MISGNAIADYGPLVEACEADVKADGRFAPFLRLYLDDSQLKEASQSNSIERLKAARVKNQSEIANPAPPGFQTVDEHPRILITKRI